MLFDLLNYLMLFSDKILKRVKGARAYQEAIRGPGSKSLRTPAEDIAMAINIIKAFVALQILVYFIAFS